MVINQKTDVDSLLRRGLSCSEAPSPDLVNKVKQYSFKEIRSMKTSYRPRIMAAAITVILLVALSTVALAATGVLGDFFSAITSGSSSRQAIVDHGFVSEVSPGVPVDAEKVTGTAEENMLTLRAYYVDSKEIGFDFIITNTTADIPDDWSMVHFTGFSMEMDYSDGETSIWEEINTDDFSSRSFPGGHFISDRVNNIHEYEPGQDFLFNTAAVMTEDGNISISFIVSFYQEPVPIGEKIRLSLGELHFVSGDNNVDPADVITVEGGWTFEFTIDNMYQNTDSLSYRLADGATIEGVEIVSVTVNPSVCRIEALIDFKASGLGNPGNANAEATPWTTAEWQSAKLDMFDLDLHATDGEGNLYRFRSSAHTDVANGIVACWIEVDSMFFDAPENLTLHFASLNGVTVDASLALSK